MTMLIQALLLLAALLLFIPIGVLFFECSAALWGAPRVNARSEQSPRVAILIPAHNEALGIAAMLQALLPQLAQEARIIVIADNCTDRTAELARGFGVTVLERNAAAQTGKSYALAYGIDYLALDPPDVIIVLDADCHAAPGALDRIARKAYATGHPVQAVYLLDVPPHANPLQLVSAFAFRVKNLVRPAGLARLRLPCMLTGSGMAFPWAALRFVPLASGRLVEDMWLSIELISRKQRVLFDPEARIVGRLAMSARGASAQRVRWEHGHLETIIEGAPRLVRAAWQQKQLLPLWLMLDLCVPPLSLLVTVWALVLISGLGESVLGYSSLPFAWSLFAGVLLLSSILAAWYKYGREDFPISMLFSVPAYVLVKLPMYGVFVTKRQRLWVRSERDQTRGEAEFIDGT